MKRFLKVLKIIGITIFSIVVLILLFIGIYSQIGNSKVEATIDGLGTKLIVFSYSSLDGDNSHIKFAYCINDKIKLRASLNNTCEASIHVLENPTTYRSKTIWFFVEPLGETKLKGKLNGISIDYDIIAGDKLSFQQAELKKELSPFYEEESRLWLKSKQLRETDREKSNKIYEQFDSLRFYTVFHKRIEFAKRHLDYELSPKYFLESDVPKDTVIKYNNLLSQNVKNSPYGMILSAMVSGWKNTENGNVAPEFSQITLDGKNFNLKQFRGKYIVLDFWGSWCGPCLRGVPKMREYYNKYKSQVEFVGIACNDNKTDWEEAIENNQMNWIQILNDKYNTDISTLYGINSFPTKIIINQKGEIINKYKGENVGFYNAVDSIMK
jgi:thiol-disulfide isomerase/thioredoxin